MKILIVEPGKHPRIADVEDKLGILQSIVGGSIEAIYPWGDPVALVCDEEGLYKDTEWNRYINKDLAIKGTFFLCGLGEESFEDLPDDLAEKYTKLLFHPHLFVRTPDGVTVVEI